MAKQQNPASQTNAQKVRQQNARSAQGQQPQQAEFASETNAQQVQQQNQRAEQKKQQNAAQGQQQQ